MSEYDPKTITQTQLSTNSDQCFVFLKEGKCKWGATCRFKHGQSRSTTASWGKKNGKGVTVQQQQVLGRGSHARHFSHDVDSDGAAYDQYDQPYRAATTHGAGVGSLGAAGGVSPGEMMNPAMLLHAARMRGGHASYDGAGSYSDNDHYMSPRDAGMYGVGGVEGSSVRAADYTQM